MLSSVYIYIHVPFSHYINYVFKTNALNKPFKHSFKLYPNKLDDYNYCPALYKLFDNGIIKITQFYVCIFY